MSVFMSIGGGFQLRQDAAESYFRAIGAGMPVGGINSAYRSKSEQEALFFSNYTSSFAHSSGRDRRVYNGVAYWRRTPYTNYVAVAVPGTSTHGEGHALDLKSPQREWLFRNPGFGWSNPRWAQDPDTFEPWHWEYNSGKDTEKDKKPVAPEEEDVKPELVGNYRGAEEKISPKQWHTVRVTSDGWYALVKGPGLTSVDFALEIQAEPGSQIQVRLYKAAQSTGSNVRVNTFNNSHVETVATSGSTFIITQLKENMNADEVICAEVIVYDTDKNPTIKSASSRALVWK